MAGVVPGVAGGVLGVAEGCLCGVEDLEGERLGVGREHEGAVERDVGAVATAEGRGEDTSSGEAALRVGCEFVPRE